MHPYIILPDSAIIFIGTTRHVIHSSSPAYPQVVTAIKANEWDSIPGILEVARSIANQTFGKLVVQNDQVLYNGEPINNALTQRILTMYRDGFDTSPMLALLKNLMANPTKTAIDEFYLFIEKSQLPITEDGCILAYKQVSTSFYDLHTNSVFNKPCHLMTATEKLTLPRPGNFNETMTDIVDGQTVVSMARNRVDANRDKECSSGLHFCSLAYLRLYSNTGQTLIIKVNPKDIVSIPQDYENTKGRCCKYTIIGVLDADEVFVKEVDDSVSLVEAYNVPVISSTVDPFLHIAYNHGYADGKKWLAQSEIYIGPASEAYMQGYKDGRGKQRRKYPRIK